MQSIRQIRLIGLVLACGLVHFSIMDAAATPSDNALLVYIGTYTGPKSQGIYLSRFNPATGELSAPELAVETKNPSFLAVHPNRRFLYAVNEVSSFGGKPAGAVSAFSRDGKSGKLTLLNQQPSGGTGPCHLAVDKTGKCVLVANYGSGSVAALPILADGRLGEPGKSIQHHGSSVNPQRQAGPHAHFITPDPANRFALACDLGLDKVLVYQLEPASANLLPNDPPGVSLKPGSGPRHLDFHPKGRFVYMINELSSTLAAFAYDAKHGALQEFQTVSTLPESFQGENLGAEVQVHPSGKFVYASNRGHDSVAVFAVDSGTGKLSYVEHQPTRGKAPRHFVIDPTGRWLLAGNQDSNSVVVFRIDAASGRLSPTGQAVEVGSPVCVQLVTGK